MVQVKRESLTVTSVTLSKCRITYKNKLNLCDTSYSIPTVLPLHG
jgi:hypothetical protein